MWMTWKCAVMNFRMAVRRVASLWTRRRCRYANWKMTRRYATEITPFIGPERDIPAPDVGTNAQVMAWIMDTYSMHRGYSMPAVGHR